MLIEFMVVTSSRALPKAAPKACPASKSIIRHCWQRLPAEVRPNRLSRHRDNRHCSLQQSDANTIARMTTQLRRFAPAVVAELERNKAAMREGRAALDASTFFETRHAQLMGQLDYALQAPTAEQPRAFAAADVLLKDYNKLAWRVEPGDIRKPAEDATSLAAWLNSPAPAALAAVDAAAPQTKRLPAEQAR